MTERYRNRRGEMGVRQGRVHTVPFPVGDWPTRTPAHQQDLDAMQQAEFAANEARSRYRAWEARQACAGCGAAPGAAHQRGCPTPWG